MKLDLYLIANGMVEFFEVVFNACPVREPFGKLAVEGLEVIGHIAHLNELLIQMSLGH
jgi:hypothetical protein